jgi:hypothetical protein
MIPKQFYLFAEKHTVRKVKKIDRQGSEGEFCPDKNKIKILSSLPKERQEQRYCHELIHCMLDHLGYDELSNNERFVDRMGKCLHQILSTSE